jgi:hypothetical protein
MRFLPLASASIALLLTAVPASAQQGMTAGALAATCAAQAQRAACTSYIQGWMDGRNQSLPKPTVCPPAGADVVGTFVEYVGKNRLEANLQAGLVLGNHLITAYPCR